MTRERQVFPRDQVAHIWASGAQDAARDPSGNFFFTGGELYSYGSHFLIGLRIATPDGAIFLMNADGYSNTTSKHASIARRAIPRYLTTVYLGGLRQESVRGRDWPVALMRRALDEAGNAFASAADVSRVSMRRDAAVSLAGERLETAETLARIFAKEHAKESRATMKLVERGRAAADQYRIVPADNKAEKAACAAGALALTEARMRRELKMAADAAIEAADHASNTDQRASTRYSHASDCVVHVEKARSIAKRYGFRCPKLPDGAALVAQLLPAYNAQRVRYACRNAREMLEYAERSRLLQRQDGGTWHRSSVERYAMQVVDHAENATRAAGSVPEWIVERAAELARKSRVGAIRDRAAGELKSLPARLESAESYAAAGYAKDAAREYRAVLASADRIAEALPDRELPADRIDAAREYLATLALRLAEEHAAAIAAWREGGARFSGAHDLPVMLRLVGDRIETSHGAIVPAAVGPSLYRILRLARAGKLSEAYRGLRVGHFELQEVRPDGSMVIGCHDIPAAELIAMADALKLGETA